MISLDSFLQIDLPAILASLLVCLSCGIGGNFLVLRKQSLLSDSLAHSVLPGIIMGFILSGTREVAPLFLGALISALTAALLIERLRQKTILESGTIMGIVYTSFFALGVLLIGQSAAKKVDLDLDCVLFGQIEYIFWLGPKDWNDFLSPNTWENFPREILTLLGVFLLIIAFITSFWKELKLTTFDSNWCHSIGLDPKFYHFALIFILSLAIIASFEAVGSMVVVALIICPAAGAKLLSRSFGSQMCLCICFSILAALLGYLTAAILPIFFNMPHALSASGMIATMSGILFSIAFLYHKLTYH